MSERQGPPTLLIAAVALIATIGTAGLGWFGWNVLNNQNDETESERPELPAANQPLRQLKGHKQFQEYLEQQRREIERQRRRARGVPVKVAENKVEKTLSAEQLLDSPEGWDESWITVEGKLSYPGWKPGEKGTKDTALLVAKSEYQGIDYSPAPERMVKLVDHSERLLRPEGTTLSVTGKLFLIDRGPTDIKRFNSRAQLENAKRTQRRLSKAAGEKPNLSTWRVIKDNEDGLVVETGREWRLVLSVKSFRVLSETPEGGPSISLAGEPVSPDTFEPQRSDDWERFTLDEGEFVRGSAPHFTSLGGDLGLIWQRRIDQRYVVKFARFAPGAAPGSVFTSRVDAARSPYRRLRLTSRNGNPLILLGHAEKGMRLARAGVPRPRRYHWELTRFAPKAHRGGDVAHAGDRLYACSLVEEEIAFYFHHADGGVPDSAESWTTYPYLQREPPLRDVYQLNFVETEDESHCEIEVFDGQPVVLIYTVSWNDSHVAVPERETPGKLEDWSLKTVGFRPTLLSGNSPRPYFLTMQDQTELVYPERLSGEAEWNRRKIAGRELQHRGGVATESGELFLGSYRQRNLSTDRRIKFRSRLTLKKLATDNFEPGAGEVIDQGFKNRKWVVRLGHEVDWARSGNRNFSAYLRCAFPNRVRRDVGITGEPYTEEIIDYSDCDLVVAREK